MTPPPSRSVQITRALAFAALALFAPLRSSAQPVPMSAYSAMRWRLVGPHRGGRVLAAVGVPQDPNTFYLGAVGGGVWKSENVGHTWTPIFDDQPIAAVGALAVAPSDANVLYVGTGEADMRGDITYGTGMFTSTDAGAHWRHIGLDDSRQIAKILIDPHDAKTVLVAALGHAYGPNAARGVFRSTDAGTTWKKALFVDDSTGAVDLAWDAANPRIVFAATWQARRPPWSQYPPDEGPGSGLWKSADEGVTWAPVRGHGLPAGQVGRIGVAVAKSGQRVYALIETRTSADAGLYRSDDGGETWSRVSVDPNIIERGWYFGQVFVDPSAPDVLYVPNRGLMRSVDGGRTFTVLKGQPGGDDYHSAWIDPTNGKRLVVGSDQGTIISVDAGRTWTSWYNQPTAQFYHVITDHRYPYRIYGAQQDAGTIGIASRSDFGLITFRDWLPIGAGEAGYIAPDPLDSNIVYGGDTYGEVFRFDWRTGQSHTVSPVTAAPFGLAMPQRKFRFTWTSPLVFDPLDLHTLYLGAQVVLKTTDGGLHWTPISPDLTGAKRPDLIGAKRPDLTAAKHGVTPAVAPPTLATASAGGWGVVYTIAPSPLVRGLIWAGTDDGHIQLTRDRGAHWRDVTPADLTPWSKVSIIDASRLDSGTAYAAIDRHRLDDIGPWIERTHDFGAHWTRINAGLPNGAYARSVRADPVRRGLLYAGTELGVYVSFDDGDHWQPLQLNLPVVPIHDLVVHDTDLVVASHGRSFWVLDDISPLRQLRADIAVGGARLFAPATAVRVRRSENRDTPLPPEEPHGDNAPAGAIIDYWLPASSGAITLEIVNAAGHVVRRFATDESPPPPAPSFFIDEWLPRPALLTTNAGHNRFVWNLRYPAPPAHAVDYDISAIAGHGSVATPEGPLAPPGSYVLRLTAGGTALTQPLHVVLDPRVHVTAAMLADQLHLALTIWNAMSDAHALQQRVDGLRAGLAAIPAGTLDASGDSARAALDGAMGKVGAADIGDAMGSVETVVGTADRTPTAQAREAFDMWRMRLAAAQARFDALVRTDLAALNARLERRGGKAVAPSVVRAARVTVEQTPGLSRQ